GFSFIKSEQIVSFMQNILSNGAGYAMNLALETELPEIAHAMQVKDATTASTRALIIKFLLNVLL
ncbi:conjugal transfer protein TraH, partial [Legionella sp. 29fVS95]|uniref:conjugal transfer protein TraH n=1 Tax=Legionella sp. 29fVS95 TaxID=3402813 RepID=UPI003AF93E46